MRENSEIAFLKVLGSRIKALREERGFSYRKMAQNCKIDYRDIQRYELGETNITILSLRQIAIALNVDLVDLINND